jgi:hypothetical protein
MSDTQQGPGWWQASDGKWYPPETHPSRQVPAPSPPPTYGTPIPTASSGTSGVPAAGPSPTTGYPVATPGSPGAPPTGSPPWGAPYAPYTPYAPYGAGPAGAPYGAGRQTNGLAVASLVCSVAGIVPFFFGVSCVVGIVLGFVALSQIKKTAGGQQGRGLAIAGIVVGFALIAIFALIVTLAVTTAHTTSTQ